MQKHNVIVSMCLRKEHDIYHIFHFHFFFAAATSSFVHVHASDMANTAPHRRRVERVRMLRRNSISATATVTQANRAD